MNMNEKVSIIIPVYNVKQYLMQAVDSALNQTYGNIEVILVDDGSTDGSEKICDYYRNLDNRIKVIHKINGGLSDARNAGLDVAEGKYVYFLDSDDWIESYCIETLYKQSLYYNLDILLFDARIVNEEGNELNDPIHYMRYYRLGNYEGVFKGKDFFRLLIKNKEHYSSVPLLFIKRTSIKNRFKKILHEDELFTVQLLYNAQRVGYCPEMLYIRRVRDGSIMNVPKSKEHYWGMCEVIKGLLEIPNKDDVIIRYVCTLYQCMEMIYIQLDNKEKNDVKEEKKVVTDLFKRNYYFHNKRLKIIVKNIKFYPLYNAVIKNKNPYLSAVIHRVQQFPNNKKILCEMKKNSGIKKIFVLGTPLHGNLGDHAIIKAQNDLLKEVFPDYQVEEISMSLYRHEKRRIKSIISKNDLLIIPGGGWMGNQWYHNEIVIEDVVKRFNKNKIIIFPQTVYFENKNDVKKQIEQAKRIFRRHKTLLMFFREKNSVDFTAKYWGIKSKLAPDIVLSLKINSNNYDRIQTLFCFRDDCEKLISKKTFDELITYVSEKEGNNNIKLITTVIGPVNSKTRDIALKKKIIEFKRAKLVITDRLHAMLFAAITGTPCIAFDNFSHKVSGVYEWIKNLDYIKLVANIDQAKMIIDEFDYSHEFKYEMICFNEFKKALKNFVDEERDNG